MFVIFGTKGVTYTAETGEFYCPVCCSRQPYARKRVRRCAHLYFIPAIPMGVEGEYIECRTCRGTFKVDVLTYDPEQAKHEVEAEIYRCARQLMVAMMMVDGDNADEEIVAIAGIYKALFGLELTRSQIMEEVEELASGAPPILDYVAGMAPYLNSDGKEALFRAALYVSAADGTLAPEEAQLLQGIAASLDMSSAHVRGLVEEMTESAA